MKKTTLILSMSSLLIIGALLFNACGEDSYNPEILSQLGVAPTKVTKASERNKPDTVTIVSDRAWTVTCDSAWVHLEQTGGNGDGTVVITVDDSRNQEARSAVALIKTDNITREVTITQAAYKETITLTPATASIRAAKDTVVALVTANVELYDYIFTDVADQAAYNAFFDGLRFSANKDSVYAYLRENPTPKERTVTLYVVDNETQGNIAEGTIKITQAASSIKASKNLVSIAAAGDTAEYVITANVAWEFLQSGDPAFELERDENIVEIGVEENTTGQPRSARFIFKQALATGTVADTLDITQYPAGAGIVVYPSTTDEFPSVGGKLDVTVVANQDWTYAFNPTSAAGWAQVQQKKDSSGLSINVLQNTDAGRSATVTLTSIDKTASASFTIKQSGKITLYSNDFNTQAKHDECTLIDKDGDGQNWGILNWGSGDYGKFSEAANALTGDGSAIYTPENYLVFPAIPVPANATFITISWYARAGYSAPNNQDKHKLIVSTVPITVANCSDIVPGAVFNVPANDFENVDLTGYAGQTIYIAIAHYDCTSPDSVVLLFDDLLVTATL